MTTPLYLLDGPPDGPQDGIGALAGVRPGGRLVLDGPEGRHAATVRRTRAGERLDVADGAGLVARCVVVGAGPGRLDLEVHRLDRLPEPSPRLVLVQALAKGGRDELAVEAATEVGVDVVLPWQANRSVVVWSGDRGQRAHRKWAAAARAAAKQARRARVPQVGPAVDTRSLVGRTAEVVAAGGAVLLLHEDADRPLAGWSPPPGAGDLLVVVGPEGGIEPGESEALTAAGALAVRLGPTVLRSSTAGPAALAVLNVALGRWG